MIVDDGLGSSLTLDYSFRTDPISELVTVGAARKALVIPFLLARDALTILFAAGFDLGRSLLEESALPLACLAAQGLPASS